MPLYSPFPGFATNAEAQAQALSDRALTPANMAVRTAFAAHKNGAAQAGIATLTATKITFGTERFDNGGYFDAALSRFTPPASPVRLSCIAQGGGFTAGTDIILLLFKNGASFARCVKQSFASGVSPTLVLTATDLANGTDYYEFYIYGTTAGTITIYGTSTETQFSGEVL